MLSKLSAVVKGNDVYALVSQNFGFISKDFAFYAVNEVILRSC